MINKDDLLNVHLAYEKEKNVDVRFGSTTKLKLAIIHLRNNNSEARSFSDFELIQLAKLQEIEAK